MNDRTQSPSDHYASAVRLLATAESPGVATDTAILAALCAIASTLLASAPRRVRRRVHESTRRKQRELDSDRSAGWARYGPPGVK